jgi:hypothetical protein
MGSAYTSDDVEGEEPSEGEGGDAAGSDDDVGLHTRPQRNRQVRAVAVP